jgi:uncharacterized repeat protein (TIGR01451 family)
VESITSHDPNDKAVLTGDTISIKQIADGIYLTYMIRFQNTGNDTAFKIVILDTLDNNLDPASLDVISSSHKYELKTDGSKNVTFTFNNVLLPDSNVNQAGSNGYICYRVKPRGTLDAGAIVKNKAYIYFDYNAAVPTNVAVTNVVVLTGVNQPQQDAGFTLFPNPAVKKLYLICAKQTGSANMRIYNLPGEVCYQSAIVNSQSEIDISLLPAGVYFVEVNSEKGKWVGRFVKE